MKIIATRDHTELSKITSEIIIEKVKRQPNTVLGLATGGTPEKTYKLLVQDHQLNETSYRDIKTVNLDEYVGLSRNHQQSYHYYMFHKLFNHLDINRKNVHIPDGMALDLEEECRRYDKILEDLHFPDIQLLGIGSNGHIGFNEPGASFSRKTYVTKLTESTRKANSRFFENEEDVPNYAITMGISKILKSKEILLLASGKSKANAIKKLLLGELDENFPASSLKFHENVTIIADELALQEVRKIKELKLLDSFCCR